MSFLFKQNDQAAVSKKEVILKGIVTYIASILLINTSIVILFAIVRKFCGVDLVEISPVHSRNMLIQDKGIWYYSLYAIFLGPLREELAFRLGLSFRHKQITLSIAVLLVCVLVPLMQGKLISDYWYFTILGACIAYVLLNKLIPETVWMNLKHRHGKFIIYLSIIIFGLLHLFNLNYSSFNWFYIPIYLLVIIPPVVLGFIATYFRLHLGFIYGLLFHCCVNGISTLFMLLTL